PTLVLKGCNVSSSVALLRQSGSRRQLTTRRELKWQKEIRATRTKATTNSRAVRAEAGKAVSRLVVAAVVVARAADNAAVAAVARAVTANQSQSVAQTLEGERSPAHLCFSLTQCYLAAAQR